MKKFIRIVLSKRNKMDIKRSFIIILIIVILTGLIAWERNSFVIDFLSVGQGDGICINIGGGECIMIDGGSSSKDNIGKYIIGPYLKNQGINRIKYWIISHKDKDHTKGLLEYLERYELGYPSIDNIILGEGKCEDIRTLAKKMSVNVINGYRGMSIKLNRKDMIKTRKEEVIIELIWPKNGEVIDNDNNSSIVVYLSYKDFQCLFMGDVEKEFDRDIIDYIKNNDLWDGKLECIKISHHGSRTGTSNEILDELNISLGIISSGEYNIYNHPHKEVLNILEERNISYYNTGENENASYIRIKEKNGEFYVEKHKG